MSKICGDPFFYKEPGKCACQLPLGHHGAHVASAEPFEFNGIAFAGTYTWGDKQIHPENAVILQCKTD